MKNIILTLSLLMLASLGYSQIKVVTSGHVGIGNSTPVEQLDVDGGVKIGTTTTDNAGTLRFNGDCFEGYDGTSWVALGGSGCGGATPSCSDGIQNQGETGIDCGGPCTPCASGCESFPDIVAARDLPNTGWNNEYNVGGNGMSGDGELCWKITAEEGNTKQSIGLDTDPSSSASGSSIDFRMMVQMRNSASQYRVYIYEGGAYKGLRVNQSSTFIGSTFCIRRTGTTIEYLFDGNVVYTSLQSSTGDLYFDNSFYDDPANSIWGSRPSSCTLADIAICPLGTYAATSPTTNNMSVVQENDGDDEILVLEQKVNDLEEMLFQLITEVEGRAIDQYENRGEYELSNKEVTFKNYPNPFDETTSVFYHVPFEYSSLEIQVFDNIGNLIRSIPLNSNKGEITLDSSDLSGGLYFTRLVKDGLMVSTIKMNRIK